MGASAVAFSKYQKRAVLIDRADKKALIKAIDILISKIDSTDRSTGALKATMLLLQSDVQDSNDIA